MSTTTCLFIGALINELIILSRNAFKRKPAAMNEFKMRKN